jgi:ParB/RepB/Spo0J family partition protein
MSKMVTLKTSEIIPGQNDRTVFGQSELEELAENIKANGLIQPPTVRYLADLDLYQIIAGERRLRAVKDILGLEEITVILVDVDDEKASAMMLAENLKRADLNPIDEARAYQSRLDKFGWTIEHLAEVASVSEEKVKSRIKLLNLAPDVQHFVAMGSLPLGHAGLMADLDTNRQRIALKIYNAGKVSLTQFRGIVGQLLEQKFQESLLDLGSFWVEQVSAGKVPKRGRMAYTGAPSRKDMPAVDISETRGNAASVIDKYIAILIASGMEAEAATIGTVYNALVRGNYLAVPDKSELIGEVVE